MVFKVLVNDNRYSFALFLFCLILLSLSQLASAASDKVCEDYVQSSLLQYNENLGNECAFNGVRWNNNAYGQNLTLLNENK